MEKFRVSEDAVSPVIGVALLLGMTMIMVSTIAVSVLAFTVPEIAPHAIIVVREAKGGLPSYGLEGITFDNNTIQLVHNGGEALDIKNTKIIISGIGQSYGCFGCGYVPPHPNVGNVRVIYTSLTKYGKISAYDTNNHALQDGLWVAGEKLLLSGEDSLNSDDAQSSVWVTVDGNSETSNNYGFKAGEKIYITVIDTDTNKVISTTFATVKPIS